MPISETLLAILTAAAALVLIDLAKAYQATGDPQVGLIAAFVGFACAFGLWQLLEPVWKG